MAALQNNFRAIIEQVTGYRVINTVAMSGGCVGDVCKVGLSNGATIVAKCGDARSGLKIEGLMLKYLAGHTMLPVPEVLHNEDCLLLMTLIDSSGGLNDSAQIDAADLLAALHDISADTFGFDFDTLIGGLHQANPKCHSWLDFFAEHRLMEMAGQGLAAGRLPGSMMRRIEALAGQLTRWLNEPPHASLIHGDVWGGNVLSANGRITGFIDPAIYFADPEIELAFSTLFSTFGDVFFSRYNEHRPIAPGFFEQRRDLYNLYPLLVHVRLFGGPYVSSVDGILTKLGF